MQAVQEDLPFPVPQCVSLVHLQGPSYLYFVYYLDEWVIILLLFWLLNFHSLRHVDRKMGRAAGEWQLPW